MSAKQLGKKTQNGGGPGGDSLQDLNLNVVRPPEASVDALPTVVDMAATEELDNKLEQDAIKVNQWATTVLTWLANYDKSSQAKRDRFAAEAVKYRKTLAGLFDHENTTIRRSTWLALFNFRFGQTYTNHAEVAMLLANMVKDNQLVETTGEGSIAAQGKNYNFPLDSCFEKKHVIEIQQAFKTMLVRVWAAVRDQWKAKMERLPRLATISLDDLAAGNPGVCVIDVPAQITNGNERDKPHRFEGGRLVVNSDGQKIFIVDVCNEVKGWGNFEWSIRDAMALSPPLFLKVESLSWDKPPFIKYILLEHGRKTKLLWFAIKRAMKHARLAGEILQTSKASTTDDEKTDSLRPRNEANGITGNGNAQDNGSNVAAETERVPEVI